MDDQAAISPLENVLSRIPLGGSPVGRVALGLGAGLAVIYFVRPSMSFFPDGTARPWIVTNWNDPEAAVFPWIAYPLIPAFVLGILI